MNHFIKIGGFGVIAAVLGIFVFIFSQIIPLFRGAKIEEMQSVSLPPQSYGILGLDEWAQLPFVVTQDGQLSFVDLQNPSPLRAAKLPFSENKKFSSVGYDPESQTLLYGTEDGYFALLKIRFEKQTEGALTKVIPQLKTSPFYSLMPQTGSVHALDYADAGETQVAAAILESEGRREVHALTLNREENLMGEGELKTGENINLSPSIQGKPVTVRVNQSAQAVVVATEDGMVYYFQREGENFQLRQNFRPFADLSDPRIASMNYLFGGVSLYFTHESGANRLFSLFVAPGEEQRRFGQTKTFPPLPGGADFYSPSLRNKAFLVGHEKLASLRYATTEEIRWQKELPLSVSLGVLSRKYNRMALLDQNSTLHLYNLDDPHPESGWKAFFGKIWYEGSPRPAYVWQSTGGSDAFEPKLSLIPLIIGTLKGTFYALIFSIPIALLAALYTSQFLDPDLRKYIKPTMEIMASLPSVILGFLAALWLAPLIEDKIPSVLLALVLVPLATFLLGIVWTRLPISIRARLPVGQEWLLLLPVMLLAYWGAWSLGPALERLLFVVTDPTTGERIADFRLWWPHVTGTPFEQRNSLVVGFMMGFAVIPIIFTIAEDSLSAVPPNLRSGALALGASRWQTAFRVILPTAFAGIFSAIMIGLGRAVGETMIVLMATGNTPIMNFDIFSGMRTLSANLAVELPEAPFQGTLYRALFLGALLLFAMTFLLNTVAELLRHRIRERFKTL